MATSAPTSTSSTSTVPPPAPAHTGLWIVGALGLTAAVVAMLWYVGALAAKPRVAMVMASSGPYWDLIEKGAREAAERHGVRLDVKRPASDEASQSRELRGLIDQGYDGVAVSPNDAARQARVLAELAAKTNLVTFDADSAVSRRLCFVGTDNYDAGRMGGQLVREAMPGGGTVIIAIGSVEKDNGQRRRQGLIDELTGATFEPNRPMVPVDGGVIKGAEYTIVATLVDNLDAGRAQTMAAEAIQKYPDAGCFVGLFASNTPAILKALDGAGKLGQIKVVGFDANEETLVGIERGHVYASIVQDAYNIGYQAVRILADASRGEPNALPLFPTFFLQCDPVTKENVSEMRKSMASRIKPGRAAPSTQPNAESPKPDASGEAAPAR